jgi:ABC-2 type transport system ATP-binding protein
MTKPIIRIHNLHKHFRVATHRNGPFSAFTNLFSSDIKTIKAVDGIQLMVMPGELIGYLGPNGAGKSTTLKMLTGLLVPTSGEIEVNGFVPWQSRKKYVQSIGAVFGQRSTLWWDLPVIDSLSLLKHIYRIPEQKFSSNLDMFIQILNLEPFLQTPVRSLSLGQKMRADLCAAFLHEPALVFLDEPTIGLDIVAKEKIRQFILHINQEQRTTILLTTHDLTDVEKLCERIVILDQGKIVFDGLLSTLKKKYGGLRQLIVDFAEDYRDIYLKDIVILKRDLNRVTFGFQREQISASELINIITQKYRIQDLEVREPDLESTIRKIYEEKLLQPTNLSG